MRAERYWSEITSTRGYIGDNGDGTFKFISKHLYTIFMCCGFKNRGDGVMGKNIRPGAGKVDTSRSGIRERDAELFTTTVRQQGRTEVELIIRDGDLFFVYLQVVAGYLKGKGGDELFVVSKKQRDMAILPHQCQASS